MAKQLSFYSTDMKPGEKTGRPPRTESQRKRSKAQRKRSRKLVWDKDFRAQVCHYCVGARAETIDHKIPLSKGGDGSKENCVPCCRECNERKGNMTYERFMIYMNRRPRLYPSQIPVHKCIDE